MDNRTEKRRDDIISHLAKPLKNGNYLFIKVIAIALLGFISNHLSAQAPVFSNDKQNVVYLGMESPISLYYSEPYDTVTTTNGSVRKISEGHYAWRPKEYRKSCLVLRSANGDSLAAVYFRVKRLRTPTPRFGGVCRGGLMGVGEFRVQQGIEVRVENIDADIKFEVVGYKITYLSKEGVVKTCYSKSNRFDDKALELIKAAKSGDVYAFENIQYRDIDGAVFDLPDIIITIK